MKLNIFSVPEGHVAGLKGKFDQVGLKAIHTGTDGPWETAFYFSAEEEPSEIPWVTFSDFFGDQQPQNLIYFGAYVFERPGHCYVLTYGKAHFYVRPFCDHEQAHPPPGPHGAGPERDLSDRDRAQDVDGHPGEPLRLVRVVALECPGRQGRRRAAVLGLQRPGSGGRRARHERVRSGRFVERAAHGPRCYRNVPGPDES